VRYPETDPCKPEPNPFRPDPSNMSPSKKETKVALAVRGVDVEPADVARGLALQPEAAHRVGDSIAGLEPPGVRNDGWCSFGSHPAVARDAECNAHLTWLVERLEPHVELLKAWQDRGWSLRISVLTVTTEKSGAAFVRAPLLRRLAARGIDTVWRTICSSA